MAGTATGLPPALASGVPGCGCDLSAQSDGALLDCVGAVRLPGRRGGAAGAGGCRVHALGVAVRIAGDAECSASVGVEASAGDGKSDGGSRPGGGGLGGGGGGPRGVVGGDDGFDLLGSGRLPPGPPFAHLVGQRAAVGVVDRVGAEQMPRFTMAMVICGTEFSPDGLQSDRGRMCHRTASANPR